MANPSLFLLPIIHWVVKEIVVMTQGAHCSSLTVALLPLLKC